MELSLTAEQKFIFDIFSGKEQYIIPPYQRPYAWGRKHCCVLLNDLKNAYFHDKDEGYFLGNIVISQNHLDRNSLEVIDGQQRLTTLLLLIKALLHFDEDNYDLKNALDIQSSRRGEETKPRLTSMVFMKEDNDFLKEALCLDLRGDNCKLTEEDNLYKANICYFYNEINRLNKRIDIQDFIDFLMFDTYLLPIVTEDTDPDKARKKALKIFSTINDRGLNLSPADILKAKLYSLALNELQHDDFIDKWRKVEEGCLENKYSIDSIFETYLLIIESEEGYFDSYRGNDIVSFFIEHNRSPFNEGDYKKVITDLLEIIKSRKIVCEIKSNKYKYKGIAVLVENLSPSNEFDKNIIEIINIFVYKNNLSDSGKMADFMEQLTKIILSYIKWSCYKNIDNCLANNSKQKLIYSQEKKLIRIIIEMILEEGNINYNLIYNKFAATLPEKIVRGTHEVFFYLLLYFYLDKKNISECSSYHIFYLDKSNIINGNNSMAVNNPLKIEPIECEEKSICSDLNDLERYKGIGKFFIHDSSIKISNDDFMNSSIPETREFIKNISGKSFEEANKIIAERTKKIHKAIDNFLS